MTARQLLRALWHQKVIALAVLGLTLVSTWAYLHNAQKLYTATAVVAVVPGRNPDGFSGLSGPTLGTLADVVRGSDVLTTARSNVPGAPEVGALRAAVTAAAVKDTFTLRISVTNPDPAMAAELANQIAKALPRYNLVADRVSYRAVDVALPPGAPARRRAG